MRIRFIILMIRWLIHLFNHSSLRIRAKKFLNKSDDDDYHHYNKIVKNVN